MVIKPTVQAPSNSSGIFPKTTWLLFSPHRLCVDGIKESNYSAKKLEKVLDKVFLYFFRFQRRLPTY
ncbi:MAG: hypothetical protein KZQ60_04095, partial [Candidatus Thiodiazotropha sp. (ex Lucinoma aequizonata)]|nr:hypothetical protein [Candidatus Thiodiazotropha sp. (ex Lucinoma aequizonata)]MCU7887327.1 hypothetical protein [Candidatus Thiodiazotropha sp. (ex Lucinoma aequizonata)]MCU7893606.1 hypothetical protein [Candidatus Thiodiazotropha sp. (ex Lucinoma aequizonata)]MCU7911716.1 hypothetical protein [Candidatus Thiodiazotropha sp. (ex Lucinoma aequizonata)]